jgi:hypothetical protein
MSTVIPRSVDLGDLLAWFESRRHMPTADDIRTRFGCSRATAYRWLMLYRTHQTQQEVFCGQRAYK